MINNNALVPTRNRGLWFDLLRMTFVAVLIVLAGTFPSVTMAQPKISPDETEVFLDDFLANELQLAGSQVRIEDGVVYIAVNQTDEKFEDMMGELSLVLVTAAAAADWSEKIRVIGFSENIPMYAVNVPTSVVNAFSDGEMDEAEFVSTWQFDGIDDGSTPDVGDPENGTPTSGKPLRLEAVADSHTYAYSWQNWNGANWGKYEVLGAGWNPTGGEKRAFIQFDLTGIDLASVTSAKLALYRYHLAGNGAKPLGIFRLTEPWIEGRGTYKPASPALPGEITWLNQPGFDPRSPASFSSVGAQPVFIEVDVTWLVKAWASGFPNHGLMLRPLGRPDGSSPEAMFGFHSREHHEANTRPRLILEVAGTPTDHDDTDVEVDDCESSNDATKLAYQTHIAKYNALTSLMAAGKGDTPEGQKAYIDFKAAKDAYERMTASNPDCKSSFDNVEIHDKVQTELSPGGITWDFETGDLRGWSKTGTAFDYQPTYGDNPTARNRGQPSAHEGNYWIGGYEKYRGHSDEQPGDVQGDGPIGTLTTDAFVIPGGQLEFLVGGGASSQTRIELLVDGQSVLQVSGKGYETMYQVTWDLSPWKGRTGRIRLVDESATGWGHINADNFRFTSKEQTEVRIKENDCLTDGTVPDCVPTGQNVGVQSGGDLVHIQGQGAIGTDAAWKASVEAPASDAWMYPGYDDGTWQAVAADWPNRPDLTSNIIGMEDTGAQWVWHPNDPDQVYFRREFVLSSRPYGATLRITADNEYVVYVNGFPVGHDEGNRVSVWNTAEHYDILTYLNTGNNVVTVIATDLGGGSGLLVDVLFER